MAPKKRSLADELAELINPAPQTDIDPDAGLHEGPLLNASDDEMDAMRAPIRQAREKGLRLRGDILLEGEDYRGRRTSRAAIFGDDDSAGGIMMADGNDTGSDEYDEGEEDDGMEAEEMEAQEGQDGRGMLADGDMLGGSGEEEASEEGQEELSGDEDQEQQGQQRAGRGKAAAHARGTANGHAAGTAAGSSDDEGQPDDESDDEDGLAARLASAQGAGTSGQQDTEMQELERQYAQLQQEGAQALLLDTQRTQRERSKGRAVKAQKQLWERALEVRILLQRCLTAGNRLPRPAAHQAVVAHDPGLQQRYAELRQGCSETIATLLELHTDLMAQHPAAAAAGKQQQEGNAATAAPSKKRGRDDDAPDHAPTSTSQANADATWRLIESAYASFAPFRDSALDRWHRRTALLSSNAALKGGTGLRALNQSISAQVGGVMRDKAKLIARTRLPAAQVQRPLLAGAVDGPQNPEPSADDDNAADDVRDPETFDDGGMYVQLLKEFLDTGGVGAGAAAAAARGPKRRKVVDRRASKGRKLRYDVMEKLVGFMAPVERPMPTFAPQLFANLFAHEGT